MKPGETAVKLAEPGKVPQAGEKFRKACETLVKVVNLVERREASRAGENIHLHCKIPGRVLPSKGECVRVYIDLEQTFIFERN